VVIRFEALGQDREMSRGRNFLISKAWNGGRDRTRTCDLLRVKQAL
jgi:hypothetical protein